MAMPSGNGRIWFLSSFVKAIQQPGIVGLMKLRGKLLDGWLFISI
jgi:hypothetical protein